MAHGGWPSWSKDSLKGQVQIVIASVQKSVPHKLHQFSENFVDSEILDRFIIDNISEDEETWLQSNFKGIESFETENVETWLNKESTKPNFILSNTSNSNSSYVSGIGKLTSPYFTFVRPKKPNVDTSKLTFTPNTLDHNVTGEGVTNVDHESDSSMASSLLLDSHVAHFDKTGLLNFDDQTESESLQNCLNQTSTWGTTNGELARAENQTTCNKSTEPVRRSFMPPIMGRSYTKFPSHQLKNDSPPPSDDNISDSLEDLNFNPKPTAGKQSEFDSRTYRKSAVKSREKLIMSFERNGAPFSPLNNGNIPYSTPLANSNASNSSPDQLFKTPLRFDSSTFSRSQLKSRKPVPFSGFQVKNPAMYQLESPGVFETFTIAKQNNGVINIDPEYLENSMDYITDVQTPSLTNLDTDAALFQESPFNQSHNMNSTVIIDKTPTSNLKNGHDLKNETFYLDTTIDVNNGPNDVNNSAVNISGSDSDGDNNVTKISLNQTYDTNQNISSILRPQALSSATLNSTFEVPHQDSYLQKSSRLVNRLSVSHDDGLEKIDLPISNSRRSFSDHKPAIPRGPLKNSKLSLPVRRTLYSSNTNIRKQVEAEESNLNYAQSSYSKPSNIKVANLKNSGLRRPVSAMERYSDVKYYNLTDKKNVLNSTFCKSATNLSASYIVEKHNSVEDVSQADDNEPEMILSCSVNSPVANHSKSTPTNQVVDPPEPKKGHEHLLFSPQKSSTPKDDEKKMGARVFAQSNDVFSNEPQTNSPEEQLNFQPFPSSPLQRNQRLDETVLLDNGPTQDRMLMNQTQTIEPTVPQPPKLLSESTFIRPQATSGLRMPSVRPPQASRLPTAAPTTGIPRFASRLPTFRMRAPAPVRK